MAKSAYFVDLIVRYPFPPVDMADPDTGLLCVGGDLTPERALSAYYQGIFPWPLSGSTPLLWFAPPKRAILFLKDFRLPRKVRRDIESSNISFAINQRFDDVIVACQNSPHRPGQHGTWITDEMVKSYCILHQQGWAHSVEAYEDNDLVGGLYGVSIGKMFAGESMFYRRSNASKLCLLALVDHLKKRGASWIDCQQQTQLLDTLGAVQVDRDEFMGLLREAAGSEISLFSNT